MDSAKRSRLNSKEVFVTAMYEGTEIGTRKETVLVEVGQKGLYNYGQTGISKLYP